MAPGKNCSFTRLGNRILINGFFQFEERHHAFNRRHLVDIQFEQIILEFSEVDIRLIKNVELEGGEVFNLPDFLLPGRIFQTKIF